MDSDVRASDPHVTVVYPPLALIWISQESSHQNTFMAPNEQTESLASWSYNHIGPVDHKTLDASTPLVVHKSGLDLRCDYVVQWLESTAPYSFNEWIGKCITTSQPATNLSMIQQQATRLPKRGGVAGKQEQNTLSLIFASQASEISDHSTFLQLKNRPTTRVAALPAWITASRHHGYLVPVFL